MVGRCMLAVVVATAFWHEKAIPLLPPLPPPASFPHFPSEREGERGAIIPDCKAKAATVRKRWKTTGGAGGGGGEGKVRSLTKEA